MSRFLVVTTLDGSPTLRIANSKPEVMPIGSSNQTQTVNQTSEAMHSLKGALSETDYLYGHAMRWLGDFPLKLISVGLGLGYIELLGLSLSQDVHFQSYELDEELRRNWLQWINNGPSSELSPVYDSIIAQMNLDLDGIKIRSQELFRSGRWKIFGPLDAQTQFPWKANCVAFDAFSAKTSPELWTEDFLTDFFQRACADTCAVATYACTGALKRALRTNGFTLDVRPGFGTKPQSLFAHRRGSGLESPTEKTLS